MIGTPGCYSDCGTCGIGGDGISGVTVNTISYNFNAMFGQAFQAVAPDNIVATGGGGGGIGDSVAGFRTCLSGLQDSRYAFVTGTGYKRTEITSLNETRTPGGGGGGGALNSRGGSGKEGWVAIRVPLSACACPSNSLADPAVVAKLSASDAYKLPDYVALLSTVCTSCPDGKSIVSGTSTCCAAGSFVLSGTTVCSTCTAGTYWDGAQCAACAAGSISVSPFTTCVSCAQGTYSGSGAGECLTCGSGKYSSSALNTACSTCIAGTYSGMLQAQSSATCVSCLGGAFSSDPAVPCAACSVGTYSLAAATACTACVSGKFTSLTGQAVCLTCSIGLFSTPGSSVCQSCPANTRLNREFTVCLANAGFYIGSAGTVFPPSPYMSGLTFTSGVETFTASSSSYYPSGANSEWSYNAFSGTETSAGNLVAKWTISSVQYATTGIIGAYTGSYSTVVDGGAIRGEWLQLQSTYQRTLGSFTILSDYGNFARAPGSFVLAGSNDGTTWTSVQAVSGLTSWTSKLLRTFFVSQIQPWYYFRLIVTNITTSDGYTGIDKLRLYDAQVTTCTGTCGVGTTKFCSPDGASFYCCTTASQYFISGTSTACVTCPANSMPDPSYQERCVANAGYYGPTLYMFDGSTSSYRNLGSKSSHAVAPVGWRPTFATVATRFGAYFDSSVNGNYYTVSNDYNTMTIAFWMYLVGPYDAGTVARFDPMSMRSNQALADPRGFNFDIGRTASGTGVGAFYVYYGTLAYNAQTAINTFPVTTWLHVALVMPSGTDRLQRAYVNGARVAIRANDSPTQDVLNYQLLLLAANVLDSRYYKGYLQQLTMYNYAMTDAEAVALYNAGTPLVFTACTTTCSAGAFRHCTNQGVGVCCSSGTYFREEVDTACQTCPQGTFSDGSGSSCAICTLANSISLNGTQCVLCPSNSVASADRTRCYTNAGYYELEKKLYAYFSFRPDNMYADQSGNSRDLSSTNGVSYAPTLDFSTTPFSGAGVVLFNNAGSSYSGVTATSNTAQSFKVSLGAGVNLYSLITDLDYYAGFSVCMWFRGADGGTAGTVNSIANQIMYSMHTSPASTSFRMLKGSTTDMAYDMYVSSVNTGSVSLSGKYSRQWTHYCGTFGYNLVGGVSTSQTKHYFDCATSSCTPITTSSSFSQEYPNLVLPNMLIGQGASDSGFYGWMSTFRFYSRILLPAEVFAVRSYNGTNTFALNTDASMQAYYPFHPASFLSDASNQGRTLGNVGTVTQFVGSTTDLQNSAYLSQPGGLASGNAQQQYFTIPSITIQNAFSLCAWYNPDNSAGSSPRIIHLTSGANTDRIEMRRDVTNNNLAVEVWNGNTNVQTSTGIYANRWQPSMWQHACFTVGGTSGNVYYNGVAESTPVTLSTPKTQVTFTASYLGNNPYSNSLYKGYLDEVRVYNRTLTPSEVLSVFQYKGFATYPSIIMPCNPVCLSTQRGHCRPDGVGVCCSKNTYFTEGQDRSCPLCPAGTFSDGSTSFCLTCTDMGTVQLLKKDLGTSVVTTLTPPIYTTVQGYDVLSLQYYVNAALTIKFSKPFEAHVLLIGGGGGAGYESSGGGGAGAVVFYPNASFNAQEIYTIGTGKGGIGRTLLDSVLDGASGTASFIGSKFRAEGGSGGGSWPKNNVVGGGSGGGGGAMNCTSGLVCETKTGYVMAANVVNGEQLLHPVKSEYVLANAGGSGYVGPANTEALKNRISSGGGGGAGTAGGGFTPGVTGCAETSSATRALCGTCGSGGDGVQSITILGETFTFSNIFGTTYNSISPDGYVAGGGGGGGYLTASPFQTCSGGRGGGGNGVKVNNNYNPAVGGVSGTGSGGGGSGATELGGSGGDGVILIRRYNGCGCPAGQYLVGATCYTCPLGTYGSMAGSTGLNQCALCEAGTYSTVVGATTIMSCRSCQSGTYSTGSGVSNVSSCIACPAGTYSVASIIPGTYRSRTSMGACLNCTFGTYVTSTGATVCLGCSVGKFGTQIGLNTSAGCVTCAPGTYLVDSGYTSTTVVPCIQCPSGKYVSASGATSAANCTGCAAGIACGARTVARCASTGVNFACCGMKQFYREGVDSTCQNCTTAGTGGDGSGTACTTCTPGFVSAGGSGYDVFHVGTNYEKRVYRFKLDGSLTVSAGILADVLVVGGGGSGGGNIGGGGGAGAVIFANNVILSPGNQGSFAITVGAGGDANERFEGGRGGSGGDSSLGNVFNASGGGAGGSLTQYRLGISGGAGGGGAACSGCTSGGGGAGGGNTVFGVPGTYPSQSFYQLGQYVQAFSGGAGGGPAVNAGFDYFKLHGGGGGWGRCTRIE